MTRGQALVPHLALLGASLLWASSFVALKIAFTGYEPMTVIFGRMAVACLVFLAWFRSFRQVRYHKGDWLPLVVMALFEPGLYFVFEAEALTWTTASQAGMIVALLPLMMGVAARIFLQERVGPRTWAGFLVAIVGAVWLSAVAESTEDAADPAWGNFLEFLAMVCATGYMVILKKLSVRYPPLYLTAVQALVGAVFFLPLMLLFDQGPWSFHPLPFWAIIYLGVGVTLGAYGLYNFGMSKIEASRASAYTNLIPVFTAAMGYLLLGERFTTPQYFAAGLVLLGVFLSQERVRKPGLTPPETVLEDEGEAAGEKRPG